MLKRKIFKKVCVGILIVLFIVIINVFPKENNNKYIVSTFNNNGYIYLLDNNNYVSKVNISFKNNILDNQILEIIDILTINNKNKIRDGFSAIIPENTKLLNYNVTNNIVTLNFNKNIKNINNFFERKMIECIVFSLLELKGINGVKILVEDKLFSNLYPEIMDKNIGINTQTNIDSINNITSTTIFYLAKYNDYSYYIPVTKYTNNTKEKINIIIDELKSSTTYNTNLVNYLNEYVTLVSSDISDSSVILNFSNLSKEDLSEEVKYAINSSIYSNYEIKNVFYYIDDVLIDNYFLSLG